MLLNVLKAGTASCYLLVYLKLTHKDSQSINRNTTLNYRSRIHFLLAMYFPIGMLVVIRYCFESLFAQIEMLLELKQSTGVYGM